MAKQNQSISIFFNQDLVLKNDIRNLITLKTIYRGLCDSTQGIFEVLDMNLQIGSKEEQFVGKADTTNFKFFPSRSGSQK